MKRYQTKGIILRRVNFGEADRIITFITPDRGKVGAMAKGVRKPKSKLAGGIELFSVSDLTLLQGKGDLDQLVGTRLEKHFGNIVSDYDRTQFAYRATEIIHRSTEDDADESYFDLLADCYCELDAANLPLAVVESWFNLQWARMHGHLPNLSQDVQGNELQAELTYMFDVENGGFSPSEHGSLNANTIKAWRILAQAKPDDLRKIRGLTEEAERSRSALQNFVEQQL